MVADQRQIDALGPVICRACATWVCDRCGAKKRDQIRWWARDHPNRSGDCCGCTVGHYAPTRHTNERLRAEHEHAYRSWDHERHTLVELMQRGVGPGWWASHIYAGLNPREVVAIDYRFGTVDLRIGECVAPGLSIINYTYSPPRKDEA